MALKRYLCKKAEHVVTEISACLNKSSKIKNESSSVLRNFSRRVLDVWKIHLNAECLSLNTSGKPKRFRSKAGGMKWFEWKKAFCELRGAAQMSVKA